MGNRYNRYSAGDDIIFTYICEISFLTNRLAVFRAPSSTCVPHTNKQLIDCKLM